MLAFCFDSTHTHTHDRWAFSIAFSALVNGDKTTVMCLTTACMLLPGFYEHTLDGMSVCVCLGWLHWWKLMSERPNMLIFFIAFRYECLSAPWLVSIALLFLSLSLDGNKCVGVMEVCWSLSDVSSPPHSFIYTQLRLKLCCHLNGERFIWCCAGLRGWKR